MTFIGQYISAKLLNNAEFDLSNPSFNYTFRFRPEFILIFCPVSIAELSHTFPSRTRLLRTPAAMVLPCGRVARCRTYFYQF